jgi:hypothetical protein
VEKGVCVIVKAERDTGAAGTALQMPRYGEDHRFRRLAQENPEQLVLAVTLPTRHALHPSVAGR